MTVSSAVAYFSTPPLNGSRVLQRMLSSQTNPSLLGNTAHGLSAKFKLVQRNVVTTGVLFPC